MEIKAKVYQAVGGHSAPPNNLKTLRLTKEKMYVPTGSRYMTRADVRKLFLGEVKQATVRNDGSQHYPKQVRGIRAHVSTTRLKIGCHVWSGRDFTVLREWALG